METHKMTIHRALAELKLIDSKIEKAINLVEPSGVMQAGKLVNGLHQKEEFETDAKAKFQSVVDLIDRKHKIKSAITMANGITQVEISGKKMTIAEAINYKSIIAFRKTLITILSRKHSVVKGKFITENEKVNNVALENAKIMIGKQGDDRVKPTDDDVKAIVEPFVRRNEFHLVDPLQVEKLVSVLQSEVDSFEAEVDAVLSEINAVTIIEI